MAKNLSFVYETLQRGSLGISCEVLCSIRPSYHTQILMHHELKTRLYNPNDKLLMCTIFLPVALVPELSALGFLPVLAREISQRYL